MKTLKLFNAVISKPQKDATPFISDNGYIIEKDAVWAKDQILNYYETEKLNGNDLNKTFHKSWKKIKESSRFELLIEQIKHYISTYGSDFEDEIYIPNEILDVPDLKLKFKVIKAYTKNEMTKKCLDILKSGIALEQDTIEDLLLILIEDLQYKFTGKENIKNKEATVLLADLYGIYPENPVEFFRFIIYRTTDKTLLIKNDDLIGQIKESGYDPTFMFNTFGLKKLAEIFNRFKPLFLAYKNKCPKTINKISKLSKKYHKSIVTNPLNLATTKLLNKNDIKWLDNATPFALFKVLNALYTREHGQEYFLYKIRNGKSWVEKNNSKKGDPIIAKNFGFILNYLQDRFNFSDKTFYFPKNIHYPLPTSEKMFVGNIPQGTKFYGDKLAVGIYWENKWGANDLDLSGISEIGKVGWNADYNHENKLYYSGDVTSAPNGAIEYLYAEKDLNYPTLIQNNVYSGINECEYKIVVGEGDSIDKQYMMNPNKVMAEVKCNSIQKQTILGMLLPNGVEQSFVIMNIGAGHARVSGNSEVSVMARNALIQQWKNSLSLKVMLAFLKGKLTENPEDADYDFSIDNIEKDTFIKLFNEEK